MGRTVAIGIQDFEQIRRNDKFYVDKTAFIREWWEQEDAVTLITRPRRFGKTLNMSMLEYFFSNQYAGRGDLFEGLSIWEDEKYRQLQGTYPVIALSFAGVKETTYRNAADTMRDLIVEIYNKFCFLAEWDGLTENERKQFQSVNNEMNERETARALNQLCCYLSRYCGKKVLVFIDEYDTPMQEAWMSGYWDEMVSFCRSLFNNTFKTNPHLERAVITGITRISKESIFSDLNNLRVVTTTSGQYAVHFGFTEEEVFRALDEQGLSDKGEQVKRWYDGFVFGNVSDIYNPWSITSFLCEKKFGTYWANTSSNGLVGTLIRRGNVSVKRTMEELLDGKGIAVKIDEQIVFSQLEHNENAIWSLLLAGGYLKAEKSWETEDGCSACALSLTNYEVKVMFEEMIRGWFQRDGSYSGFVKALLRGDVEEMNAYMRDVAGEVVSSFDSGKKPSETKTPERFYHGLVLGLIVELRGRYHITSNRESGYGRYDVMLRPLEDGLDGIVMEFKVWNREKEATLGDTAAAALAQIGKKNYDEELVAGGIRRERIRHYGFAFRGKEVYIAGD